jgi:phosphoglycolate phosphatase-like HAD superfamily hydrolase
VKIILFDIDGTLANCEHRRHYVASKPKNWPAFNRAMKHDTPHDDIIYLYKLLEENKNIMLIASGRGDDDRAVTEEWLKNHGIVPQKLYMRKSKDSRSDDIVKEEILEQVRKDFGEPYLWFDDRNQVVNAIRANGIRVLQVAPGDF